MNSSAVLSSSASGTALSPDEQAAAQHKLARAPVVNLDRVLLFEARSQLREREIVWRQTEAWGLRATLLAAPKRGQDAHREKHTTCDAHGVEVGTPLDAAIRWSGPPALAVAPASASAPAPASHDSEAAKASCAAAAAAAAL